MLREFEMGKRYVFSTQQYKKRCQQIGDDFEASLGWKYELDGQEVIVLDKKNGDIDGYLVDPHWCIEKEDI